MAAPFVVLDIDGVLADVRHRLHYVAARPKNWAAFFAAADQDDVLDVGVEFARHAASSHEVVYLTGRPERVRAATQSWLDQHQLPRGRLLMRPEGDHRPSAVVKVRELRGLRRESTVALLVDDDPTVVEAARAAGFTVRHADWMPRAVEGHRSPADDALFSIDVLHDAQELEGRT
jgi:phosphoglycolate phosphatase-like HAD superfamily hydrolase